MDVIGPQEEVAGKNVTAEQIHHLGLAIGRGRAGPGDFLKVEDDEQFGPTQNQACVGWLRIGYLRIAS